MALILGKEELWPPVTGSKGKEIKQYRTQIPTYLKNIGNRYFANRYFFNRVAKPKVEACSTSHPSPSEDQPLEEPFCQDTVIELVLEVGVESQKGQCQLRTDALALGA